MISTNVDIDFVAEYLDKTNVKIVESFDCGTPSINEFLHQKAIEYNSNGQGTTTLILNSINNDIIGYYTLCCASLLHNPDGKEHRGLPAVEIKMFAINKSYQDVWIGNKVLSDVILQSIIDAVTELVFELLGIKFLVLNSVESAVNFYIRNGFSRFEEFMTPLYDPYSEDCTPMYMRIL